MLESSPLESTMLVGRLAVIQKVKLLLLLLIMIIMITVIISNGQ